MRETRAEKNCISEEGFRRWVRVMHRQFMESQAITTYINGTTYVYLRSKVGIARRNPNDTSNPQVGIAYAWARCTGQQEYYNIEDVYNPVAGDLVNVKFINSRTYPWTFVAEGVDNYCFRRGDGHLECYYKDSIKSITKAR